MMKGMGNLLKQAQLLQKRLREVQEEIARLVAEGSAGGGMVTAKVDGRHRVVAVKIAPEVVQADDVEMLEDLVAAAVNDAMRKLEEMSRERMEEVARSLGVNLPGLGGLFSG